MLNAPGFSGAISHIRNTSSDYLKAEFGQPGARSRFKWDFPYTTKTAFPYHRPATADLKETQQIEITQTRPMDGGVELAALLILPCDDSDFATEMVKVLCGLNYDKWNISQKLNFNK